MSLKTIAVSRCVSIINRDHRNVVSLDKQDQIESKWFYDNVISLIADDQKEIIERIKSRVCVGNLISNIDAFYKGFIKSVWKPETIVKITTNINKLQKELNELGSIVTKDNLEVYNKLISDNLSQIVVEPQDIEQIKKILLDKMTCTSPLNIQQCQVYIEKIIKELSEENGSLLLNKIKEYFKMRIFYSNDIHKLKRFVGLYNKLSTEFETIYYENLEELHNSITVRTCVLNEINTNYNGVNTTIIAQKITNIFCYNMMHSLRELNADLKLTLNDFTESTEYQEKRKSFNTDISKLKQITTSINTHIV